MKIYNTEYEICDTIECIGIADSFIKGGNKIGIGHGESKLYIGQISDNKILSFLIWKISEVKSLNVLS